MDERLARSIGGKITSYIEKCTSLKDHSKMLPLDDIGRKTLKLYFKSNKIEEIDSKLLIIIESYIYMCKCRRQKGQAYSEQIIQEIKESINQFRQMIPVEIKIGDLKEKNEFAKVIEQIMKYLDVKYKKQIIDKKYIYQTFENYPLDQYKNNKIIHLTTLFGQNQ